MEVRYLTEIEAHVFIAIRDLSGELDMNRDAFVELDQELVNVFDLFEIEFFWQTA